MRDPGRRRPDPQGLHLPRRRARRPRTGPACRRPPTPAQVAYAEPATGPARSPTGRAGSRADRYVRPNLRLEAGLGRPEAWDDPVVGIRSWPLLRQLDGDPLGLGRAAQSRRSRGLPGPHRRRRPGRRARSARTAPSAAASVVYVAGRADHPDRGRPATARSPGARCARRARRRVSSSSQPGRAAPRSSTGARTAPSGRSSPLDAAMDMIADRVHRHPRETAGRTPTTTAAASTARSASRTSAARRSTTRRTTSSRSCSRRWASSRSRTRPAYDTPPRSPVWGPRSGAAAPPRFQQDLQNADCILIMGSNMAESHPVGFRWVMEAQERGATDHPRRPALHAARARWPTCTCRSAPGSDIAFLGGLIHYVLENEP